MKPYLEFVNTIPGSTTPARVFHKTGKIQINMSRWNTIPDAFHKKFIINHEVGHFTGKTDNEIYADAYASNKLLGTEPFSLRKSITALSDNITQDSPAKDARVRAQTIRALRYDYYINHNQKALEALKIWYPEEAALIETNSFEGASSFDTKNINYKNLGILAVAIIALITIIIVINKSKNG
jgi:hypothetical protein